MNIIKSIIVYMIKFCDTLISWKSKKQSTIFRSSVEAEYRSLTSVVAEVVWLIDLFKELNELDLTVTLYCDSKAALQITVNLVFYMRTKHIDVDCHFIREKILKI